MKAHKLSVSPRAKRLLTAALASLALGSSLHAWDIGAPIVIQSADLLTDYDLTGTQASTIWTNLSNTNSGFGNKVGSGTFTVISPGYQATMGLYSFSRDFGATLEQPGSNIKNVVVQLAKIANPDYYVRGEAGKPEAVLLFNHVDKDNIFTLGYGHPNPTASGYNANLDNVWDGRSAYAGGPVLRYQLTGDSTWYLLDAQPTLVSFQGSGVYDPNYTASFHDAAWQWDLTGVAGNVVNVKVWVPIIVHAATVGGEIKVGTAWSPVLPGKSAVTKVWRGGATANWDTSATIWGGTAWSNAGHNAAFNATGTTTLTADIAASSLLFGETRTVAASSTYKLTLSGYVDVADAKTATITAPIAGTSGLHKTNTGKLVLGGANTFTNGIYVYDGEVELNGASFATANFVNIAQDAFFDIGNVNYTANVLQADPGSTVVVPSGQTLTIAGARQSQIRGNIEGAGTIVKSTNTRLEIQDAATSFTGTLTLNAGDTYILADGELGTGVTVTVNSGATLSGSGTINGDVHYASGSDTLIVPGQPLTVNGTLTFDTTAAVTLGSGASGQVFVSTNDIPAPIPSNLAYLSPTNHKVLVK